MFMHFPSAFHTLALPEMEEMYIIYRDGLDIVQWCYMGVSYY